MRFKQTKINYAISLKNTTFLEENVLEGTMNFTNEQEENLSIL